VVGVLLDLDGTLVDSNHAIVQAWLEALVEAGIFVHYSDIFERIGQPVEQSLPELTGISLHSELGHRLRSRKDEIFFSDYLGRVRAFPGARDLLDLLSRSSIPCRAIFPGKKVYAERLLLQARLDDLITELTSADDLVGAESESDLLNEAIATMGFPREKVALICDTPDDLLNAKRAGVRSIAFACGGWSRERLVGASAIYSGPWELVTAFHTSIFAAAAEVA